MGKIKETCHQSYALGTNKELCQVRRYLTWGVENGSMNRVCQRHMGRNRERMWRVYNLENMSLGFASE